MRRCRPAQGEIAFDAWLKIAADGVVTVAVPQLEMGQGVSTLLPQVVAMELGADWRQVAVEPAPVSGAYANLPLAARWASCACRCCRCWLMMRAICLLRTLGRAEPLYRHCRRHFAGRL